LSSSSSSSSSSDEEGGEFKDTEMGVVMAIPPLPTSASTTTTPAGGSGSGREEEGVGKGIDLMTAIAIPLCWSVPLCGLGWGLYMTFLKVLKI